MTTTVKEQEVSSLHRNLQYREDAVEKEDDMNGPAFNMRTWAASSRRAGTAVKSSNVKRMQKWDTSYVEEVVEEKSFLNNGISALLDARREPTKAKSSSRMRESIRRFQPGGEANKTVLLALEKDSTAAVYPSSLPFEAVPAPSRTFLEGDILRPLHRAEEEEAASAAAGVSSDALRSFGPTSKSVTEFVPRSSSAVVVEQDEHADGVHSPVGSAQPLEYEATRDVDLPAFQDVNYVEMYREQEIVDNERVEQEGIYKSLVEDLDEHMGSVRETFNAMLDGTFTVKRERRKKDPPTILPTDEDFGDPNGRRVAFVLASNPTFTKVSNESNPLM